MNTLEKLFNSIESSPKVRKTRCVDECIIQLREYVYDFPVYILKRIHVLLTSLTTDDRKSGYAILKSIAPHFELTLGFKEVDLRAESKYYSSAVAFAGGNTDIKSQKAYIKEKFKLDIKDLVLEKDFEVGKSNINVTKKDIIIEIENVYDFFSLIEYNLLSSEWYKRHGSFLAYIALVECYLGRGDGESGADLGPQLNFLSGDAGDGDVFTEVPLPQRVHTATKVATIALPPDLVSATLEILHEDKFSDFINDQTITPVREAASYLLSLVYPTYAFKTQVIHFLVSFLEEDDWQVQFSALIAFKYLKSKVQLPTVIARCLASNDEDVKYLSASILSYYVDTKGTPERTCVNSVRVCYDSGIVSTEESVSYNELLDLSLASLKNSNGISLSYASLLSLVSKLSTAKIEGKMIWSCFRYPVQDVRLAILNCLHLLKDRRKILLRLSQNVLVEENEEVKSLSKKRFREYYDKSYSRELIQIITRRDLFYDRRDFDEHADDEHDDLYFNLSGVKTLGRERIWEGRCELFKLMDEVEGNIELTRSVAGIVFGILFNIQGEGARQKHLSYEARLGEVLLLIDEDLKPFKKELRRMEDTEYVSVHPKSIELHADITKVRSCVELEMGVIGVATYNLLSEQSAFSALVCFMILKLNLCEDALILHMYSAKNKMFFRELGTGLVEYGAYEKIKKEKDLRLFSEIVEYTKMECMEWAFVEAMDAFHCYEDIQVTQVSVEDLGTAQKTKKKKEASSEHAPKKFKLGNVLSGDVQATKPAVTNPCAKIVRHFIKVLAYNEAFVMRMLSSFDVRFLNACIDSSEPSFNPLFVKPVLKCMNQNVSRAAAADCFSKMVPTLAFGVDKRISTDLQEMVCAEKKDIEELYTAKCQEYIFRCPMQIELRPYQVEGINWLYFLKKFHVNGILGDDMGLGKTIQVLTLICNEIWECRAEEGTENTHCVHVEDGGKKAKGSSEKDAKAKKAVLKDNTQTPRVLVICPSSLVGHWKSEIEKYFPFASSELYNKKVSCADILILSYDTYRNDYQSLTSTAWFYVVLDEGHVLRNRDTLLYNRILLLHAEHKVLLSGTPVQNEAADLINLFNILMPGYLKMDELRVLHKRVLPFVLRRLKSDVLSELPPKIIRDVVVDMESSQRDAYNTEFVSIATTGAEPEMAEGQNPAIAQITYGNVNKRYSSFSKMQHLLKLCSSFKSSAFEDLLTLMGGNEMKSKTLVFCQLKSTIDMVIRQVEKTFPSLRYLRLDGSVPPKNRQKIVTDFNTLNYNLLFLTTQIGGLGLNLTSADTVIFYEHDWNPFNDLQAMDRAHRLGQKKTVNVFRIILKDTIEEKVMSYQNFKMYVANTLVNYENKDVSQMDLKDTLERFREDEAAASESSEDGGAFLH